MTTTDRPIHILLMTTTITLRIPVDRDRSFRFDVTEDSEFA
jgi:hypothetical protein